MEKDSNADPELLEKNVDPELLEKIVDDKIAGAIDPLKYLERMVGPELNFNFNKMNRRKIRRLENYAVYIKSKIKKQYK